MKKYIAAISLAIVVSHGYGQEATDPQTTRKKTASFGAGQMDISTGAEFNSGVGSLSYVVLPVCLTYDIGVSKNISIGLYGGFSQYNIKTTSTRYVETWNYDYYGGYYTYTPYTTTQTTVISNMTGGVRAAWHFNVSNKIDVYTGGMMGFVGVNVDGKIANGDEKNITYNWYAGARYRFLPWLGVYLEAGAGGTTKTAGGCLNGGLNFRLRQPHSSMGGRRSDADELIKLKSLLDEGGLTKEEYEQMKSKIIK